MTPQEIENLVRSYIAQSCDNQEKENNKFDFKREWYNLKEQKGKFEFLKDSTAIVNTFDPDGFLVFGFDDKTKKFKDARLSDSGLRDSSDLSPLISKHVDRLFHINHHDFPLDGHLISVIHLPPSLDKPHVIRLYKTFDVDGKVKTEEQHKTFVRRGSGSGNASKYDLDLMYYDRKNILPDYELQITSTLEECNPVYVRRVDTPNQAFGNTGRFLLKMLLPLTFENIGRRPIAICKVEIDVQINYESWHSSFTLETGPTILKNNILISPGHVETRPAVVMMGKTEFATNVNSAEEHLTLLKQDLSWMNGSTTTVFLTNGKSISSSLMVHRGEH